MGEIQSSNNKIIKNKNYKKRFIFLIIFFTIVSLGLFFLGWAIGDSKNYEKNGSIDRIDLSKFQTNYLDYNIEINQFDNKAKRFIPNLALANDIYKKAVDDSFIHNSSNNKESDNFYSLVHNTNMTLSLIDTNGKVFDLLNNAQFTLDEFKETFKLNLKFNEDTIFNFDHNNYEKINYVKSALTINEFKFNLDLKKYDLSNDKANLSMIFENDFNKLDTNLTNDDLYNMAYQKVLDYYSFLWIYGINNINDLRNSGLSLSIIKSDSLLADDKTILDLPSDDQYRVDINSENSKIFTSSVSWLELDLNVNYKTKNLNDLPITTKVNLKSNSDVSDLKTNIESQIVKLIGLKNINNDKLDDCLNFDIEYKNNPTKWSDKLNSDSYLVNITILKEYISPILTGQFVKDINVNLN